MELKTNKENTYIKLEVFYHLGGYSWATYKHEERGYYLSIKPEKIEKRDGLAMVTFSAFSGYKILLEKATRLSRKKLEELNKCINIEKYKHIIDIVAEENNLILEKQ